MGTILIILFFMVIACILISCTICDFVVRLKSRKSSVPLRTLAKFSIYTNAMKLLSTEITPGTIPAIHGMRFLSTCSIIIHHRSFATIMNHIINLSDLYKVKHSVLAGVNILLLYAVDTFFVISGFLATYSFLKKLRSGGKINVLELYLHRYIRLTPCVGILLLIFIFIIPYLGSGPMWQSILGGQIEHCRKNWWTNLLFIHNFVNREEMCLVHTWQLAAEMQFFLLSPIILYPLFHRPNLGLIILGVLSIVSLITPAYQIVVNGYSFIFTTTKSHLMSYNDFFNSYTITYNRALPYLVGIFLGYDVVNNKRQIPKMQVVFNWILACVFILFCFRNTYFIQPMASEYHAVSEAVHVSIGRLGWSLAVAWILYACTHGYGGPVTRFLSLPIFIPLSRMSYSIYLVHFLIQVGTKAMQRTADFFTLFSMIHLIGGDIVISVVIAFVLNVCIETPAITLEEVLRSKQPAAMMNSAPPWREEKQSAIKCEFSDLTHRQVRSDPVIETKMPQIDFWRTMSDVLNTLSTRPIKTPTEWAETWQRWRNNTQLEIWWKEIQNESSNSQTDVTTIEQELLIFIVAVSRGLDDAASFKESDKIEPTASCQLISHNSQRIDFVQLTSDSTTITKKTS